ncbi:MAG: TonB-dependent receptor, partial [candidate division Zixibacteria bacterium]
IDYDYGQSRHGLTYSRRLSTGYINNTEYDIESLSYSGSLLTSAGMIRFSGRYCDKEFGAYKFYSDAFPNEWEATETGLLSASADLTVGSIRLSPKLFYRRHTDDFVLDRDRPSFYRNNHRTDHYGAELQTDFDSPVGRIAVGVELAAEEIESSNLGPHYRSRKGMFVENRIRPTDRLIIVPGASFYHHNGYGWQAYPGLDINYRINKKLQAYGTVGRAYRVPTFTELYYVSPANMGNRDLRPEKSVTWETGLKWSQNWLNGSLAYFERHGRDMIDWVRPADVVPYQVQNISRTTTRGVEIEARFRLKSLISNSSVDLVTVGYSYFDTERSSRGFQQKYFLDQVRHQVTMSVNYHWISSVDQNWSVRYLKRYDRKSHTIVDSRLTADMKAVTLFAELTNLFDVDFVETGSIPMPGRWFRMGLKLSTEMF